jgi:hypothetical protein
MSDEDVLGLSFDQYQRHRIIQESIDLIRWQFSLNVLDLGGSPGCLTRFLPNDQVVVAELTREDGSDLSASAFSLPFADASFDIVVSSDT